MKKLLIIAALMICFTGVYAKSEKVKIMHHGKILNISINALQAHLNHPGDEIMILFQGEWVTESQYIILYAEYQQYQDATVEEEGEFDEEEGEY